MSHSSGHYADEPSEERQDKRQKLCQNTIDHDFALNPMGNDPMLSLRLLGGLNLVLTDGSTSGRLGSKPQGLLAIENQDTSQSTAMAGGEATLETAFMEAWSLLSDGMAPRVLVVYHDEPLPELYRGQPTTVLNSAAFAMLLRLPDSGRDAIDLRLSWDPQEEIPAEPCTASDPALRVLGLLLKGGDPVVLDTHRLVWTWSTSDQAA